MIDIISLARRFSRKLEIGKGAQFSGDELALMAALGVNDIIQEASAKKLREQCQKHVVRKLSTNEEHIGLTGSQTAKISSSPITTLSQGGSESLARVQTILKLPVARSTRSTSKTPKGKISVLPVGNRGQKP